VLYALLTVVAFLSVFLSATGVAAIFALIRLPSFGLWWWLVWLAMFLRWRASVVAVAMNKQQQRAPVAVIVMDLLASAAVFILAGVLLVRMVWP
jgi:hypothetical protein